MQKKLHCNFDIFVGENICPIPLLHLILVLLLLLLQCRPSGTIIPNYFHAIKNHTFILQCFDTQHMMQHDMGNTHCCAQAYSEMRRPLDESIERCRRKRIEILMHEREKMPWASSSSSGPSGTTNHNNPTSILQCFDTQHMMQQGMGNTHCCAQVQSEICRPLDESIERCRRKCIERSMHQ